jgi:hypothetical protein
MIIYELYDSYGNKVTNHLHGAANFETIIIEHEGQYYRPIIYDLGEPSVAKCVPVQVVKCGEGSKVNAQVSN